MNSMFFFLENYVIKMNRRYGIKSIDGFRLCHPKRHHFAFCFELKA